MKSKKLLIFCLVAVFALSLMGFGFAKWSDTVTIGATVATGNVDISIEPGKVLDEGVDPQKWPEANNCEKKDVAQTELTAVGCDKNELDLKITNDYPWYLTGYTFRINGEGTVPVKIEDIKTKIQSDRLGLKDFIVVKNWTIHVVNPASNGLPAEDRTIESNKYTNSWDGLVKALKGIQIHQGGYVEVTVNFYIRETIKCGWQTKIAPQKANLSAKIEINAAQWNEVN
ncbi:MAG TPA: hypothetical protein GXX21_02115 [Syntrophomonadaceae bacterium]|nr:hypothetical protein [Syntrophomonadaceae bacterium]